ncbi:MAG TPA: tetratricopeptide repeat protein [Thermoanaerobaculia bacterium]|nr:tetratricopeptide repeat protein [Thermoanaerobaculia bacterium]
MTKRFYVCLFSCLLLLAGCHPEQPSTPATQQLSNSIILITIDTLRADSVGYAGNTRVKTPFLDSLAARGIVFTNAHAHNVVTLPSHVNILTGLYPWQHGVRDNAGFVLDPKFPTLASLLHDKGYATGAFIGAFPLDARFGLNHGFDVYDDNYGKGSSSTDFIMQERPATAVLAAATKWWSANDGRKRFMWVHLYDAHAPYKPPPQFTNPDPYLGEIESVDDALSKQLAPLIANDTLVVVTGDHGEARGDHGELTHGLFAYESTLKIPLIVAGAGIAHRNEAGYVRHIDIAPTILGNRTPEMRGVSLLEPIGSRDSYFEALSASLNRGWAPLTGIIHNSGKYIELPISELYALPDEQHNLRDDRRRDVDAARQLLASCTTGSQPVARSQVSAEDAAQLRSLGYVAGNANQKASYGPNDDPKNLIAVDTKMHGVIDAYERGEIAKSVALAREVVRAQPDMPAGLELLAFTLQQSEHVGEAIAIYRRLKSDDAKVQLALLLSETGRSAEAAQILAPMSGNIDALNAYGIALADQGRFDEAMSVFNRVLQTDPNNAPALQNLGITALRRDDLAGAQQNLDRALALNPRLPLALNTRGVVYARENDFPHAVEYWQLAVKVDPRQYDALFNIGLVEGRAGHVAAARDALQRFVRTAPPARYAEEIKTAKQALR